MAASEHMFTCVGVFAACRAAIPTEAHDALGLTYNDSADDADDAAVNSIMAADVRWLLCHDPKPALERLPCPVLAIGGGLDLQVPPDNLQMTREVVEAHNTSGLVRVREFPQCNHLFQTATTGAVSEYQAIEETVRPEVTLELAKWVHEADGWWQQQQQK